MGRCFQRDELQVQAEECFQTAIQLDENNIEARMELAKMYESLNEQEQAFIYVNEVMSIKNGQNAKPVKQRKRGPRKAKEPKEPKRSNANDPPLRPKEVPEPASDDS